MRNPLLYLIAATLLACLIYAIGQAHAGTRHVRTLDCTYTGSGWSCE